MRPKNIQHYSRCLWLTLPPLLLSPLLFRSSKPYDCLYGTLIVVIYWLTEVMPLAATSLLPVVLFPMLGVASTVEICSSYMKDTTMLCIGTLAMTLAVEECNLHKRMALRFLKQLNSRPILLMIGVITIATFISSWVSDLACTALMLPIVMVIFEILSYERNLKRPVEANKDREATETKKSDWLLTPSERLKFDTLPKRDQALCKALLLFCSHGALIGGMTVLTATGTNLIFREKIYEKLGEKNSRITWLSWFAFSFPSTIFYMLASLFSVLVVLFGPKEMLSAFKKPAKEDEDVFKRLSEDVQKQYDNLGPMSFAEKSVLFLFGLTTLGWITRSPGFMPGWAETIFGKNGDMLTDATVAIFITVLLFIWPKDCPKLVTKTWSSNQLPFVKESLKKSEKCETLLSWTSMQHKFAWNVILIIGGGFAISQAVKASCLGNLITDSTQDVLSHFPPILVQILVTVTTAITTQLVSNIATANIFVPIALHLADAINVHPLYLSLPTAIAPSFAFLFVPSTPSNALVFDTGLIRISEMASAGAFLCMSCILISTINMNTWAFWLFNLGTIPEYNHLLNSTSLCEL